MTYNTKSHWPVLVDDGRVDDRCWCGDPVIHLRWCQAHSPRCRSGAHFIGNCLCIGTSQQSGSGSNRTVRELQVSLPWTIRYSRDFRANPQPHKDFTHALIHVGKALGKLLALADDMDHDRAVADDPTLRERHAKYIADLVVCALRASNTFPGGAIDLQAAVEHRITEKNVPVKVERND